MDIVRILERSEIDIENVIENIHNEFLISVIDALRQNGREHVCLVNNPNEPLEIREERFLTLFPSTVARVPNYWECYVFDPIAKKIIERIAPEYIEKFNSENLPIKLRYYNIIYPPDSK